jgi:hypothetical protein
MAVEDTWLADAKRKIERMPAEAKSVRETAMQDLYFFARLVNPGFMYGDIHKEIFKWMQEYTLFGAGSEATNNKLIMLPRAHLKSHMVATWSSWIITRHPDVTILYVSATAELAETQLYAIQNIMASNQYMRYFPEYINPQEGKRERWSQRKFSIDHEVRRKEGIRDATVSTAGLTTNTTGWHADIIVADDLVVPENAYTVDGREGVMRKASQFTSIRNAGGFTMACGTRYHPADIYSTWKAQEFDVYDSEGNTLSREPVWSIKEFAVESEGVFLWPKAMRSDGKNFGFDKQVLARIKAEYSDRTQFYAQYYNDPNDPGSNRINRNCFQYYDKKFLKSSDGKWFFKGKKLNIYAAIDFAFSLNKRADSTAIVVIGVCSDGFIYVLDIDVFKTDRISDYYDAIIRLHSLWDFKKFRAEVTVAQSIIVRDLKDKIRAEGLSISIDEYRPQKNEGSKVERMAATLEPRYENMSVWHFKGGYTDVLEEELIQARPAHDDVKNALADAIDISVKPKAAYSEARQNVVQFNSRFGGVQFR